MSDDKGTGSGEVSGDKGAASSNAVETKPETGHDEGNKKEYDELKDRMVRLAAEFDNYKKKARKDIDVAKIIGKAEVIKDILSVLDEFEVALVATEKFKDDGIAKGFALLYSNFLDALKREGLKEVPAKGMLNPYMHEAIMTLESDKPAGTILEVVKKGYTLNDILLRPASVIVAKEQEIKKLDEETKK